MFIFNTTFVVADTANDAFIKWVNGTYLPLLKKILPAIEVGIYEVLSAEKQDGKSISIQWKANTPNDLEVLNKQSPLVLKQMSSEFGQNVLYFSSILKQI